ncbi:GerMN domain-containing protein [Microbispora sp. RL4-1S]|uniref:GerMN domain-containing protein n=1 Tax=Microbispora oryzae TaxID=2806554 RepID=A0A941AKE8_9ACTN|nr:LpqB family beta-propeller domain-containing protein [Microbispora oryzae]MBP2706017.1 GerMN domain-containing protein [Microbispora oryzae]
MRAEPPVRGVTRVQAGRRRAVAGAAMLLLCGGCATVPTSSIPRASREIDGRDTLSQPYIRMIATPPRAGALPEDVLKGFQSAMASFDDPALDIARRYLTPAAAAKWNPWRETRVYEGKIEWDRPPDFTKATRAVASIKGTVVATIDPQGSYRSTRGSLEQSFSMVKVQGEWRIDSAPDVRLLSADDLSRAYRKVDLCFPPSTGYPGLVVDRVWVPIEPSRGVAETVIRRLLAGPTSDIAGAVTSAFPRGTDLNRITVEGDTVVVDLTAAAETVPSESLDAMKAQLVWTLGDLVTGRTVEIRVNGEGFQDSTLRFKPSDYARFDPNVLGGSPPSYYLQSGRLYQAKADKGGGAPVQGPAGGQATKYDHPAVSGDEGRPQVAARVTGADAGVYVTDMAKDGQWREWIPGKDLTPPSWDRYNSVWSAERAGLQQTRVWAAAGGQPQKVAIPEELATSHVLALRVSRDGARVAVVADDGLGPGIKIGTVVRVGGQISVQGLYTLVDPREDQKIRDIAWRDAADLLVLSEGKNGQELTTWSVMEDTTLSDPAIKFDATAKIESIAAAPGQVLAGDKDGTVLKYDIDKKDSQVVAKEGASSPVYPLG